MKLIQHPEYTTYVRNMEMGQRCQRAVADWKAKGEPIIAEAYSLCWTFESAQGFVRSLARMFQEYNRVLWERFPYCQRCGGQCCVVDASRIRAFDAIALALLNQRLPTLPEQIEVTARECIYHVLQGCRLPVEWRTIKCWSFYCLGSGQWSSSDSLAESHSTITRALAEVVLDLLPDALRRHSVLSGNSLIAHLDDPVDFADSLDAALFDVFVGPFDVRYPVIDGQSPHGHDGNADEPGTGTPEALPRNDDVLAFIAEAVEQVCESSPPGLNAPEIASDQLLADLELLEWIILGHPRHGARLLEEMYLRYVRAPAPKTGAQATIWHRMRNHILRLKQSWD